MSIDHVIIVMQYIVVPLVGGLLIYVWKDIMHRIDNLEQEQKNKMTEEEVRRLMEDKVGPVKESLAEIKTRLDFIIERLLNQKN
jgi:hypothetical protein